MRKIRVLADHILVKRLEMPDHTRGGIYIRPEDREIREEGTVLQVGPVSSVSRKKMIEPPVAVGDTICFNRFAGTEILFKGEHFLIMSFEEITAVQDPG